LQIELNGGDRELANGHVYDISEVDMLIVVKREQSNQDTGTCSCPRVRYYYSYYFFPVVCILFRAAKYCVKLSQKYTNDIIDGLNANYNTPTMCRRHNTRHKRNS